VVSSSGESTKCLKYAQFEVLTVVVTNFAIFWDVLGEYITSIFRVGNQPGKKPGFSRWLGYIPEDGNMPTISLRMHH
jgi:hypothetical protein